MILVEYIAAVHIYIRCWLKVRKCLLKYKTSSLLNFTIENICEDLGIIPKIAAELVFALRKMYTYTEITAISPRQACEIAQLLALCIAAAQRLIRTFPVL